MFSHEGRSALVVKALGMSVSYTLMAKRFSSGIDYERAVTGVPWMVGDNYLTVHPWTKDFNPYEHEISSTLVWARLLEIPIHYFHPVAVKKIGQRIGKPIRVDQATSTGARIDYARVCVKVDLTKPLLSKFSLHGKKYFIQYKGLENIYLKCGTYVTRGCCSCMEKSMEVEATTNVNNVDIPSEEPDALYGEWMIAQRRSRPRKENVGRDIATGKSKMGNGKGLKDGPGGSRFTILVADEMEEDTVTGRTQGEGSSSEKAGKEPGKKTKVDTNKQVQRTKDTVLLAHPSEEDLNVPTTSIPMKVQPPLPASTQPRTAKYGVQPMEPNAMQGHHVRPPDNQSHQMESSGNLPLEEMNEIIAEGLVNEASTT
ncbi:unnamed protein product [Linum trigynum]|uniref:DUF4283 domain-containing protein n=1 Tax=Linum trigynum TaxID=586398 RepID=A0AAV2CGN8_9ROSI